MSMYVYSPWHPYGHMGQARLYLYKVELYKLFNIFTEKYKKKHNLSLCVHLFRVAFKIKKFLFLSPYYSICIFSKYSFIYREKQYSYQLLLDRLPLRNKSDKEKITMGMAENTS